MITDAKKQREAFDLLEKEVFGLAAYQFPPKLYSFLAASHWGHWGMGRDTNPDLPVQKLVLAMQDAVLNQILGADVDAAYRLGAEDSRSGRRFHGGRYDGAADGGDLQRD